MSSAPSTGYKPVIGLIGAIGAGKSTVASAMGRRQAHVIDADKLGHLALEDPEVRKRLRNHWGESVFKADGSVNRRAIANIVFSDSSERKVLESWVYPVIGRLAQNEIVAAQENPAVRFVVLDAAVLLEAGWKEVCDQIVYVDAPLEVRQSRVSKRSGWSASDLGKRELAQWTADEKKKHAHVIVENVDSEEHLQSRVDHLLRQWNLLP